MDIDQALAQESSHLSFDGVDNLPVNLNTTIKDILEVYPTGFFDGCKTYHSLLTKIIKYHKAHLYVGTGVGGVLIYPHNKEEYVLLYKRYKEPENGLWCMPGGSVLYSKTIQASLIEKFKNLTGLKISFDELRLLRVTNHFHPGESAGDQFHYLSPAFLVKFNDKYLETISFNKTKRNGSTLKREITYNGKKINIDLQWHPIGEVFKNPLNYTDTTKYALQTYIEMNELEGKIFDYVNQLKNYKNYESREK